MADKGGGGRTIAEIDNEAIEKFNRQLEQSIEREAKLLRQYEWRGNKLPPFNIEHMPYERQRLSGAGMTSEDRALRRQWLKDQELSHHEPRNIPELNPRNPFRRAFAAPWDALFKALRPVLVGSSPSC
jgi:NADH dehydrogenase (ubiquinone) 1 beta subcomplex subunit 6